MVGHYFECMRRHVVFGGDFGNQSFQTAINGSDQNLPPVFGTPHEMVFEAEYRSGIRSVSRCRRHTEQYTIVSYLVKSRRATARAAIPPPAEAGGFSRISL